MLSKQELDAALAAERAMYRALSEVQDITRELLDAVDRQDQVSVRLFLSMRQDYSFYTPPQREDYLDLETHFEKGVRLRLTAGRAQYQEQGEGALDALVHSTLEEFKKSFGK